MFASNEEQEAITAANDNGSGNLVIKTDQSGLTEIILYRFSQNQFQIESLKLSDWFLDLCIKFVFPKAKTALFKVIGIFMLTLPNSIFGMAQNSTNDVKPIDFFNYLHVAKNFTMVQDLNMALLFNLSGFYLEITHFASMCNLKIEFPYARARCECGRRKSADQNG